MSKLKSDIRRNKDHLATNEQLKALLASHQQPHRLRFKQIFNDATPAAIKDYPVVIGDLSVSCLMRLALF